MTTDQIVSAIGHDELRSQQIKMRRLEIAATLAEWKRAFIVEGIERPFADRCTLEAEYAALALEARVISTRATEEKAARRIALGRTVFAHLQAILKERGLDDILAEAETRAAADQEVA